MIDFRPTAPTGNSSRQRPSILLIVNADDFGLSARINEGILLAHRAGIVTATSLMAVGQAFEHAVQCCRAVPALDVGVHLTLVAERPLLPCRSSLAGDDGRFPAGAGAFLQHWLTGRIRRTDVQAEWSAQIERVLDHGIRVTHLDSHQHVHILPGLADLSLQLAARYNIPFVRVPVEDLWGDRWPSLHGINRMFGATVLRASWLLARLAGAKTSKYRPLRFLGFQDGGRLDNLRLRRLLHALRPGRAYELMCHPGLTPEEPDVKLWQYGHEKELQALTNPAIRSEIAARGIQLCNFKDLT
jgi:predicted glycoside hydrolase/deacetylase ChbG (UPF0249 family)